MWSWISFGIGVLVGGGFGVITMCLCFVASHNDNYNDKK